jgi:hypothetical protein
MNAPSQLTGSHLRTYKMIFQHPVSHNLGWHDVHALFRQLGTVEEEANGNLKVTRNGQSIVLHPHHAKDVSETSEVMYLRHFIERSESPPPEANQGETHWLLVIDHHEARIFRSEMHGAMPQKILLDGGGKYFRHAQDSMEISRGKEKPDPNSFFEPVVQALRGGGQILIFGTGTGTSSEMEQFIAWSKVHHPQLASRFIGSLGVDEHHLSEGRLLAKAREFYAKAGMA